MTSIAYSEISESDRGRFTEPLIETDFVGYQNEDVRHIEVI